MPSSPLARRAYLDWNATTPLHPEAKAAMLAALDIVGNPSSIHQEGRAARAMLEAARADVAALVGGEAENTVFTSGASEALSALMRIGPCASCGGTALAGAVLMSAVEHVAVLAAAPPEARIIPVDSRGLVDEEALRRALKAHGPALVFIQLANNETGVIQPIATLSAIIHDAGGLLVVDGVQAPGKMPLDITALGADALVLSAHKFGGPKGVGAMIFRNASVRLASPFIAGGGQERGQRGGTENLPGILGMGAAARAVLQDRAAPQRMAALRDAFERALLALHPEALLVNAAPRLPNTTLFALPGVSASQALITFDLGGVAVSSGSACSSGKVKASHVLEAMGAAPALREGAVRVSLGCETSEAEMAQALAVLAKFTVKPIKKSEAA